MKKSENGKIPNFKRTTKKSSPTTHSGVASFPPKVNSFMYIETSSGNPGSDKVFCGFERTDVIRFIIIKVSIITDTQL